ncbi:DUF4649 family protein [Streptococcus suis]|nr:DUF4649 family protein [Streptococcus suis]
MITIYYKNSYKIDKQQDFENLELAKIAFSGCVTLPDYYPVTRIIKDGKDLHFKGTIGDVYHYLQTLD